MNRGSVVAWGALTVCLTGFFALPPIWKILTTERSASAPLSRAIVAVMGAAPKGFTDVSEELCATVDEESLALAVSELWPLDAKFSSTKGIVSASFKRSNSFLEGVQTLWFDVDDETDFCSAKVQTYSW